MLRPINKANPIFNIKKNEAIKRAITNLDAIEDNTSDDLSIARNRYRSILVSR